MSCLKCKELITDNQFWDCDGCRQKIHSACSELSPTEQRCMTLKNRTLKYLCQPCQGGLQMVPLLKAKIDELENRFNKFSQENATITPNLAPTTSDPCLQIESILMEMEERKIRAKNLMIYNLPESQNDDSKVKDIISTVADSNIIKKLYRVGKAGNKPRPIKLY